MNKKIAITTGDKLGIGKEIIEKALLKLNLPKENILIIGEKIKNLDYETLEIKEENNGEFCWQTLFNACQLAKESKIQAIVTAPVSKKVLNDAGYKFSGQTEVLEKLLSENKIGTNIKFTKREIQ